ncbi:hypothetical protein [Streptomyces sp. enrichment culture]|uniref:hypothetical protein n=1 Tax=Streptomyces sp. enrichment culture TaxID=1795815 RepID=UPI003F56E2CB
MDGKAILFILAIAGVVSILLFALKALLDQVPDVIESAGRARDAWKRFQKKGNEEGQQVGLKEQTGEALAEQSPTSGRDQNPPAAA